MQLKTLIVDDEYSAIEGLMIRLESFPQIDVIGHANSVDDAVSIINKTQPNLIFLDIEMPEKSGFELVKYFIGNYCPAVIFVTAFHQHAVQAFEVKAVDYLLKPVKLQRLGEAIERASERLSSVVNKQQLLEMRESYLNAQQPKLTNSTKIETLVEANNLIIQDGRNPIQLVPYNDILCIDAAGDYMCVHTQQETFVMRARMKSLEKDTLPADFVRIHKSAIVNLKHVKRLEPLRNSEYNAILKNDKSMKVSRTYSKELKSRLLKNSGYLLSQSLN
ncbi:LytR/AlgR family response regulator transcription factor [Pseudoalteromonas sp. S3431]|uniref:LytR/AlgR family response regulator transcription factor n=1 Tax=Pseudoalteromonas sp. S3431 TaxID=579537 RepID=UPI0004A108C9|nr:LytTR family DNA-binding domain-containing protein [Pseudoalteromonas sp. S3431]KDC54462.1 LytT family transcriptional regulator [Pseudoalteromonas sp. S3431]